MTARDDFDPLAPQREAAFFYGLFLRGHDVETLRQDIDVPRTMMEKWMKEEAADGFNVVFPFLPQGLDDVADRVVPELQRRGLFRKEYEGTTLRDHLGLPRPENRFFTSVSEAAE